jgi:energy-converting hydrogenase Eha subunit C
MNWINLVCGIIFFLLSPGVILTLPPLSKGVFMSGQTSILSAAVHAVIFVIVHHSVNAYLQKHYGMEEPKMK